MYVFLYLQVASIAIHKCWLRENAQLREETWMSNKVMEVRDSDVEMTKLLVDSASTHVLKMLCYTIAPSWYSGKRGESYAEQSAQAGRMIPKGKH